VSRAPLAAAVYVGTVVAANVMTANLGLVQLPATGLLVTAGTFAAGLSLIARDWVQQTARRWWAVPVLIVVAALVSAVTATPALAVASGVAFLVAEVVDWGVFTPLRGRSLPLAVVVSSLVAAPVDTVLFLHLAGFPVTWEAVAGQVLVKTVMALAVAVWLKVRAR
jgi:uncharacterized PurR-regulated membrane protein YhhQ (DUF165 family)